MYPIGETKLINYAGPPDLGDVDLRPPPGVEWIPSFLKACHTNVANSLLTWLIDNPGYPDAIVVGSETTATNAYSWLFSDAVLPMTNHPLRLTHELYARVAVTLEAGKYIKIEGVVLERPANLELTLAEWASYLSKKSLPAGLDTLKYRIEHYRGGI